MSSDPIEVLRELRDRAARDLRSAQGVAEEQKPRARISALDAAIASLSAPKPSSVNDNAVAVNESAPVNDKPESAEAAWRRGLGLAPPRPEASAPVGVEGFEQWYARVDARFWNNWDACNAAFHAGKRSALAQQQLAAASAALAGQQQGGAS